MYRPPSRRSTLLEPRPWWGLHATSLDLATTALGGLLVEGSRTSSTEGHMDRSVRRTVRGLLALAAAGALAPGVAQAASGSAVWDAVGTPAATHGGHAAEIHAAGAKAFSRL